MTTEERLQSIQASKAAIKAAIQAKGIECDEVLSSYAQRISEIQAGGDDSSKYAYRVPMADIEGLRALGWDDESINYYLYNNLAASYVIEDYKVTEGNKALKDLITSKSKVSAYATNPDLIYCPKFDTSQETDLQYLFKDCRFMIWAPNFDTALATTTQSMFYRCTALMGIPPLDLSSCQRVPEMFMGCNNLQYVPDLDLTNADTINGLFRDCSKLCYAPNLKLGKAQATDYLFKNCVQLISIPTYDFSNITSTTEIFYNNYKLAHVGGFTGLKCDLAIDQSGGSLTHDSIMNIIDKAADVTASPKTLTLGSTNLAKLTDEEKAIATGKGWTLK